ncbi:MAG TPA: ABC transporter ATPase [Ktedonobacter sp.]|nr:ABC transporter ATPase [Ktedonobacter sp.]
MDDANKPAGGGVIQFTRGPLAGSVFTLNKLTTSIGRDATNDIIVKDDLQVSRKHIRLLYNNGVWSVEKHQNANILTIDGQQIPQAAILQNNTTVGLGQDTSFVFKRQGQAPQASFISSQPLQRPAPVQPSIHGSQPLTPQMPLSPMQQQPFPGQPYQPSQPLPQYPVQASSPLTPIASIAPVQPGNGGTQHISATAIGPISASDTVIGTPFSPGGQQAVPSLIMTTNIDNNKQRFRLDKPVINVGKDNAKTNTFNDINISYPIISSRHFQVVRQGNDLVLIHPHPERQQTVNGLMYKGLRILGHEHWEHVLAPGDIFRIGNEQGTLITLTYDDGSGVQEEQAPPVQDILLRNVKELTIGRKPDNAVVLPHPQVSGHHALLKQEGGTYRITDLNSTNHVYVNSVQTADQLLKLGDEIRIGPYRLVYDGNRLRQFDESNFIRIDARNLKKTGNNNVTLLDDISIAIPPRKFVALVGGSGAGKSTLMDALNGLRPAQSGQVLYNDMDYYRNLAAFSNQLGYVPQDDIVHKDLTVERALYYAARMRLPSDFTNEQIQQRINEVLEDVEMTRRRKLLIKKLSGGQRKRVSIALELLANPGIFFLDEPTSGLDPGLDRRMMLLLRKLADAGHTIVLVTHATNNIKTCDYVCFLCSGGRLAYFGPPEEANDYFGKSDFAEIYTSLEPTEDNPDIPAEAQVRFKNSPLYKQYVEEPLRNAGQVTAARPALAAKPVGQSAQAAQPVTKKAKVVKRGNPFTQFGLLFQRNMELLINDRGNLIILLLQAPLIALFLMLLIYFEVGTGLFDANKVIQCTPQLISSSFVTQQNPSGVVGITRAKGAKDSDTVDCNKIIAYLQNNTDGVPNVDGTASSNGTIYASKHGGVTNALQDFIVPGNVNPQRALFIIAFVAVLFGCINGTREIVKEASIYRRERTVNLGIIPYICAKVFVMALFALFQSAALLFIVNAFEPLHQGISLPVLLEMYITIVLSGFAGLMIGLTASAFAPNEDTANSLLPFILIPQVIFAGVEIPLKDYALQIIAFLFPTRWAMAAMGSSIGLHADKIGGDKLFGNDYTYHSTLFSTYSQSDAWHRLLLSWGALGAIVVVLAIFIGVALKRKDVRV